MRSTLPAIALSLGLAASAQALDIVMIYDILNSTEPPGDPAGIKLQIIMLEVESVYERIIKDAGTVTIRYRYTPNTGGLANATSTPGGNGKPLSGDIDVDIYTGDPGETNTTPLLWFYDDTPGTDEHWDMEQTLFRDLSGTEQTTRFGPNNLPPDELEVSWRGAAKATAPADARNGFDLFTSMLHETGHVLGVAGNYSPNGDTGFVTDADFTGGNDFRVKFDTGTDDNGNPFTDQGHLAGSGDKQLMCGSCAESGYRRRPTASDMIAMATLGGWQTIDLPRKEFLSGSSWNTAANWIGNRVPDADDDVWVRSGSTVSLAADSTADSLYVGYLSRVLTNGHDLIVDDHTQLVRDQVPPGGVIVSPPRLEVDSGGIFETTDLTINVNTLLQADGGSSYVNDDLINLGSISGFGAVNADGIFRNDGSITANGGTLTLGGDADINLDGTGDELGMVRASTGDLRIASPLSDPFGSTITIGAEHSVQFYDPWILGSNGTVTMTGSVDPEQAACLLGEATVRGAIVCTGEGEVSSGLFTLATATIPGQNLIGVYFESGSTVTLTNAEDRLRVLGAEVQPGAVFTGAGVLKNDWTLNLADGANVGVKLTNGGTNLTIAGTGRGSATVQEFLQWRGGNINFDLGTSITGHDVLNVTGTATLRGTCTVNISALGNGRWRIINAASVTGTFATLVQEGNNGGTATLEYFPDGVDVVITDGALIMDSIPGTLEPWSPGHRFPMPSANARMSSSNTSVVRVEGDRIVPAGPGTATLQFESGGQILTKTVVVPAPPGGACPPYGLYQQILAPDGRPDDFFGSSVSMSGDTLITGAPAGDAPAVADCGAAYVHVRTPAGWMLQAKLLPPVPAAGQQFGFSVAVDGNFALVGAPGTLGGAGTAHLFSRNGAGTWTLVQNLAAPVALAGRRFGQSVSLAVGSPSPAAIGAPGDADRGADAGAVYTYTSGGSPLAPDAKLYAADAAAGDRLGRSLQRNGLLLLAGAPAKAANAGAAYLFSRAGGAWAQTQKLTAPAAAGGDLFGTSVSLRGTLAMVGAPGRTAGAALSGAAFLIETNPLAAALTRTLAPAAAADGTGTSVLLTNCAAIAGSPLRDALAANGGAAATWVEPGWVPGQLLAAPDSRAGDLLGTSLAGDGIYLAAGAPSDDDRALNAGSVYVAEAGYIPGAGPAPGGGYSTWEKEQFGPSDPNAGQTARDDDGDGRTRFQEYVQGTNPKGSDSGATTVTTAPAGGKMRRVRLSTRVNRTALTDFRIIWELSSDGTYWGSASTDAEIIPGPGGTPDLVEGEVLVPDSAPRMIFRARMLPASTGGTNKPAEQ